MADRTEPEMPQVPADNLKVAGPPDTEILSTPEISAPMLDVHAPHQTVHTWKDFLVHIAAISIGLLIALGLEATVQWVHHKHQAQQALELLKQEIDRNRIALKNDMRSGDIASPGQHRRLSDTSKPGSVKFPNSNDSSGRQVTVIPRRDRPSADVRLAVTRSPKRTLVRAESCSYAAWTGRSSRRSSVRRAAGGGTTRHHTLTVVIGETIASVRSIEKL